MNEEPEECPTCPVCGDSQDWVDCWNCEDGYSDHDCGEDCCCCAEPENNVVCDICGGEGGYWVCQSWGRHERRAEIPEDVRGFIYSVTLHLQAIGGKTREQNNEMFQRAYRLYVKYDVENRRAVKGGKDERNIK